MHNQLVDWPQVKAWQHSHVSVNALQNLPTTELVQHHLCPNKPK